MRFPGRHPIPAGTGLAWGLLFFLGLAPVARAQPLPKVHPGYDLVDLRPTDFQPQVTGMQFLPDGRLLVLTHEPVFNKPVIPGNLYVVSGVGGNSSAGVTVKRLASNIFCATGLLVHDGRIFMTEKTRLVEILGLDKGEFAMDPAKDSLAGKYRTIYTYGWSNNFHEFAFGPLYRKEADGKGYFYVALSTAWDATKSSDDQNLANKNKNRASLIKISEETGTAEVVLSGIRTPNGLNFGPGGEIFQTDNQGNWVPAGKLNHLQAGRFYGFKNTVGGAFDDKPASPPAIWMPHGDISASPTDPTLLTQGTYAGQLLIGDVRFGGLQRCFLERINGEYQGAVFKFSGGFQTAFNHIEIGPDGAIYLGGIGAQNASFWTWTGANGPMYWALNKLKPNNNPVFDFLAVRSLGPDKVELQFTEPVDASAANPANYDIRTWTYTPTSVYNNLPQGTQTRAITSAALTPSGDRVVLGVSGLKAGGVGYVMDVKIKSIASKSGRPLWTNEAWYTLNQFGPGESSSGIDRLEKGKNAAPRSDPFRVLGWDAGGLRFQTGSNGDWKASLKDGFGRTLREFQGKGNDSRLDLPQAAFPAGIYWLVLANAAGTYPHKLLRY